MDVFVSGASECKCMRVCGCARAGVREGTNAHTPRCDHSVM